MTEDWKEHTEAIARVLVDKESAAGLILQLSETPGVSLEVLIRSMGDEEDTREIAQQQVEQAIEALTEIGLVNTTGGALYFLTELGTITADMINQIIARPE